MNDDFEQELYEQPDYDTFEENQLDQDRFLGEYDTEEEEFDEELHDPYEPVEDRSDW